MITPRPDETGTCDGCGARVLWTRTVPGNAMRAVNPQPHPQGQTAVYRDGTGGLKSRQLNAERPRLEALETLFMTHHATCPAPRTRRAVSRPARPQRRPWQHPGWTP